MSKPPISLINVVTYYSGEQHQIDAIRYLEGAILDKNPEILTNFADFWRKKTVADDHRDLPQGEIVWNDFNAKVSKYFTVREVTNGDRRRIPQNSDIKQNILTLAQELDRVREAWGSPLLVNSWYRPPAVNRAVGGASNSQHLYGKAADIRPAQGNIYDFQKWLDNVAWKDKALGYGAKKGFVHVDLRPGRIRWNY